MIPAAEINRLSKAHRWIQDKGTQWKSLAEQYRIEHHGASPANHILCKVLTSVEVEETADFEQVGETLIMDDPDVPVDRYPSSVEAIEQCNPASPYCPGDPVPRIPSDQPRDQ